MDNHSETNEYAIETTVMAVVLPCCSICNEVPAEGIKGVIRVGKAWICGDCEQEIVELEIGDPNYGVILDRIRKVWR